MTLIPKKLNEAVRKHRAEIEADLPRRLEQRKQRAFQEVNRLVEEFRAVDPQFGIIILFGSLAEDRVRSENFDIDLSFEG